MVVELITKRMNDLIKEKDDLICTDLCLEIKDRRLNLNRSQYELSAGIYISLLSDSKIRVTVDELLALYDRSERLH